MKRPPRGHLVGSFQGVHQFPEADERPLVHALHVDPEVVPVARVAQDLVKLEDLTEEGRRHEGGGGASEAPPALRHLTL